MISLSQLTEQDWDKMSQDIQNISTVNESTIYTNIGNALHDQGYQVSTSATNELVVPKINAKSPLEVMNYVSDTAPLSSDDAEASGRNLWQRIKAKLKNVICNTPAIQNIITGDGTLKDYLKTIIPILLAAIGAVALNPLVLAIISGVVALIVKIGFKDYCTV